MMVNGHESLKGSVFISNPCERDLGFSERCSNSPSSSYLPDLLWGGEAIEIVLSCSEEGEARRASGSRLNARRGTYIEYVELGRDPIQTKIKTRNSFTRFEESVPRSVIPDKEPHVIIVDHYCSNMDALVVFMSADPKT